MLVGKDVAEDLALTSSTTAKSKEELPESRLDFRHGPSNADCDSSQVGAIASRQTSVIATATSVRRSKVVY